MLWFCSVFPQWFRDIFSNLCSCLIHLKFPVKLWQCPYYFHQKQWERAEMLLTFLQTYLSKSHTNEHISQRNQVSYKRYLALTYYSIKLSTSQGNLLRAFLHRNTLPASERARLSWAHSQTPGQQWTHIYEHFVLLSGCVWNLILKIINMHLSVWGVPYYELVPVFCD